MSHITKATLCSQAPLSNFRISPKTWRIMAFADAICMFPQATGIYHCPTTTPSFEKDLTKMFYGLVVFGGGGKSKKKKFFSLVDAKTCKNIVEMFFLSGKTLETFNFISFYLLRLHFDSPSLQFSRKIFVKR